MAAALLVSTLSRRLQPPCAALLLLATMQLTNASHAAPQPSTAVHGVLAQIAPERS